MAKVRTSIQFLKYDDKFKAFKAGEIIFKENDPGLFMYVVRKGSVELRREGQLLEVVESGQFFGEMALIEHSTRCATATACTACELVQLDEAKFTYMVGQTPYFALDVLRVMAKRLRHTTETVTRISGRLQSVMRGA